MTTPILTITAYGQPAPQGSKRHVGRGIVVESSKAVKPWRDDVRNAAAKLIECHCPDDCGALGPGYPLDGPLVVRMVFTFARPRSHYRTGRNAHLLAVSAPDRPKGAPDLSKLLRSTEDALTTAGVWKDDARVVEYQRAAKVWVDEDPEALRAPGVVIQVWRYNPALDLALPVVTKDSAALTRIRAWVNTYPQVPAGVDVSRDREMSMVLAVRRLLGDELPPTARFGDDRSLRDPVDVVALPERVAS